MKTISYVDWARYREMQQSKKAEVNTETLFSESREEKETIDSHVNIFGLGTDKKSESKNK